MQLCMLVSCQLTFVAFTDQQYQRFALGQHVATTIMGDWDELFTLIEVYDEPNRPHG